MTLSLDPVAHVVYNLPAVGAPRAGFNLGLIVGTSTVISTVTRVVVYASLAAMVTAGFSTGSAEYLAAVKYFDARPKPTQVAIGRQGSGETCLAALQACRTINKDWYIAYVIGAGNSDHAAIAAWIEALTDPYSVYFYQSADSAILTNTAGNTFLVSKTASYSRSLGLYSNVAHAVAAVMGYAMGQTSDNAGSAYTLKFKTLPGVATEDLNSTQVANIEVNSGNVYLNRGTFYNMLEGGSMFSGSWFDEVIFLDKLANNIQINVGNLLYQTPKVPQAEAGMAQLKAVISQACDAMVDVGFIGPGQWNGQTILTLKPGDYLATGYIILSDALNAQSQADRDARVAPSIYVAIKLAGAIHSVIIQINVNR